MHATQTIVAGGKSTTIAYADVLLLEQDKGMIKITLAKGGVSTTLSVLCDVEADAEQTIKLLQDGWDAWLRQEDDDDQEGEW